MLQVIPLFESLTPQRRYSHTTHFQALKKISETDLISAKAKAAMAEGDLAKAQNLYCEYFSALDQYLVGHLDVLDQWFYTYWRLVDRYHRIKTTTRSNRASGSAFGCDLATESSGPR